MERITNITPIDEFYNKMSKNEIYTEYFNTYQMYDLCLKQFDDLEASLRVVSRNQDTVKIEQILDILKSQQQERIELFNEQMREQETTIVCMDGDRE